MKLPEDLRYTPDHEWVRLEGDEAVMGITDYAQDALGDVVFVSLPSPGSSHAKGDPVAEVESTKSVSDIFMPVGGTILTVNEDLREHPELINSDPYGEGWICRLRPNGEDIESLLDAAGYGQLLEG
jgi:glycine cleavage system H protein